VNPARLSPWISTRNLHPRSGSGGRVELFEGMLFSLIFGEVAVYFADLAAPAFSFDVGKLHELVMGPVQVIADKGYLLVKTVEGVAGYSPGAVKVSWKDSPQWGHLRSRTRSPSPLILR